MGYYMRFYDTDPRPLRLASLRAALRRVDPAYALDAPDPAEPGFGILRYADLVRAEVTLSRPGDGLFDDERAEHLAAVTAGRGRGKAAVAEVLREARRSVVVCVRFGTKGVEETLTRIDPLWEWLFENRWGLVHAEDEGFYNDDGLILAVK